MHLSYWHHFFTSHTLSSLLNCGNWKSMGVVCVCVSLLCVCRPAEILYYSCSKFQFS